jgi:hypothetical protein
MMEGTKHKVVELLCLMICVGSDYNYTLFRLVAFISVPLISIMYLVIEPQLDQITCNQCKNIVYAQNVDSQNNLLYNNASQQWTDKNNGIKVLFTNSPAEPLVDAPTELRFFVHNLMTDKNLNNLVARVTITTNNSGQERTIKFSNISAPTGNFSLKYQFPDYGMYQIITNIRSNTSAVALASFRVIVPMPTLNTPDISALPAGIAIIIVGIAVLIGIFIKTRRPA